MHVSTFFLNTVVFDSLMMMMMMQVKSEPYLNVKLSDIGLGTSAAPTYFPSHRFQNDQVQFDLVDGALSANNPVNIHPKLKFRQILIIVKKLLNKNN